MIGCTGCACGFVAETAGLADANDLDDAISLGVFAGGYVDGAVRTVGGVAVIWFSGTSFDGRGAIGVAGDPAAEGAGTGFGDWLAFADAFIACMFCGRRRAAATASCSGRIFAGCRSKYS